MAEEREHRNRLEVSSFKFHASRFVFGLFAGLFNSFLLLDKLKPIIHENKKNVISISIGYFQPGLTGKVESMINHEFKNSLIPAIQKLKGNISYNAGIDREKYAMTNVSFRETEEDANQMTTLKEMLDMRDIFVSLGLKFIEITNHSVLWNLPL